MTNELNTGQRLANAVRWRSKTLWRRTLGRAGYERRQAEAAAKPSLARVAQLVVPDATPDDLALAGRMLDALLPTMDRPSRATLGLIAEHTILMIERNLEPDVDLASVRIRSEASRAGGAGLAAASRVVNYLRDSHVAKLNPLLMLL